MASSSMGYPPSFDAGERYDDWDEAPVAPRRRLRAVLTTALWTAGSLGAFVGAIAWAYDLGSRNPAEVPAFRDPSASWKLAPADPGGWRAPDQDSAAYAPLGESRELLDPSATLGPTPEQPPAADLAVAARRAEIGERPPADSRSEIDSASFSAVMRQEAARPDPLERRAAIDLDAQRPLAGTPGERLAARPDFPPNLGTDSETPPPNAVLYREGGAPAQAAAATPAANAEAAVDAPPEAGPPAVEEVATAETRTPAEPAAAPVAAASDKVAAREREAAAAEAGAAEIQLAALDSTRAVERRWAELQSAQKELLGSRGMRIQPVTISGAKLYRLRVTGFSDRAEANALCGKLQAKGVECFTTTR